MMMSVGAIYLKLGKLLQVKGFLAAKKDLSGRLERKVVKLSGKEQDDVRCWPDKKQHRASIEMDAVDHADRQRNRGWTLDNAVGTVDDTSAKIYRGVC